MDGNRIAQFELLQKLGEGGMGEVYKARDTRLDRFVAIKLLPEAKALDAERRARFVQEARSASALNHPGIVTIHDIAEQDGRHYIVMEFVDGQPLNERIPRKGMPLTEGLRLAVQIADALGAAHAAGIVHRDIKPANIMVDTQGRVKVLDFGLAKLTESKTGTKGEETPTVAMNAPLTQEGAIVGSVPYMSPEQVEGRPIDARSDIFSFGAVLYEMFTGRRAFQGETRISTLAAVVERDPAPAGEVSAGIPAELERIISRCLRKDPARRSQNMPDVKLALEELRDESESGTVSNRSRLNPAPTRLSWVKYVWVAALAVVGLGGYLLWKRSQPGVPVTVTLTQITDTGHVMGNSGSSALSPDGRYLAYVEQRALVGAEYRLFTRQLAGGSAVQVLGPEKTLFGVTFSPDNNSIYAIRTEDRKNVLYQLPVLGGPLRKVVTDIYGPVAFSPDGGRMAFPRYEQGSQPGHATSSIVVANPDGSGERVITTDPKRVFRKVRWSPDGRTIAAITTTFGALLVPVDGGAPVEFKVPGWRQLESVEWLRSGKGFLVTAEEQSAGFTAHHQVLEVSYPEGKVTRVTNDLSDHHEMSVAANGTSMVLTDLVNASNIWVGPAADPDKAVKIIGGRSQGFRGVAWTKDGRLVFGDEASTGYVMNADGSGLRLFSSDRQGVWSPRLCGPGPLLTFIGGLGDSGAEISAADPDGGALRKVVADAWRSANGIPPPAACTPDGAFVLVSKRDGLWKIPLTGKYGDPGIRLFENAYQGIVSPDGKWIAMYVRPSGPEGTVKLTVKSMTGGADAKFPETLRYIFDWLPDSSGLVYGKLEGEVGNLWTLPLGGGLEKQLTHATSDFVLSFAYSGDGRLAIARGAQTRDVVLIERK